MLLTMMKSKIHRIRVTHTRLTYDGSCAIDVDILEYANIRENEQIHIYNVNTGARFITYAIPDERGSGNVSINGAAARLAQVDDVLIICAYGQYDTGMSGLMTPCIAYMDENNRMLEYVTAA